MKKTTSIFVNIITGVLLIGILALGYFTFFNTNTPVAPDIATGDATLALPADEIVATSLQVSETAEKLSMLSRSVASSTEILNTQAFQSLTDFSTVVPEEPVGREFPFSKTSWRLTLEAAEKAALAKLAATQTSASSVISTPSSISVPSFATSTPTSIGAAPSSNEPGI